MEVLVLMDGSGHCKSCSNSIEKFQKYKFVGIDDLLKKMDTTILTLCDTMIENYCHYSDKCNNKG